MELDDEHSSPHPPSQRLWATPSWLLNQVASRANRLVAEAADRPGMRLRYAILAGLDEFGPISQAELSRRLGVDRGDLVKALNELEAEGLAARSADPSDRRRNSLQLTPEGETALIGLDALVGSAQTRLLTPLSSDEREQLNSLLKRLLEHHDGHHRS